MAASHLSISSNIWLFSILTSLVLCGSKKWRKNIFSPSRNNESFGWFDNRLNEFLNEDKLLNFVG